MTIPVLDLLNFESDLAEGCEYVLTSPRSLQACAQLGIKPIELLRVTFHELVAERPDLSVREAREYLIELNESRNDTLQRALVVRREIIKGNEMRSRGYVGGPTVSSGPTAPKKTKSDTHVTDRRQRAMTPPPAVRSISSPHVHDPVSLTPLGDSLLKSSSLPPSLISSARKSSRQLSHAARQNERLVNSIVKKYSDRRAEIKKARRSWLRWEEEKIRIELEKGKELKSIQARVARSRKELEHDNIAMNEKRNLEAAKELIQREAKIKEKMRKAEVNANQKRIEKEVRIRENMELEKRKKESVNERLKQSERANLLKEQELSIKLDAKLSAAEKSRKIKLLRDAANVQRRNQQTRKHFEETYNECQARQNQLNKKKEMDLMNRLTQAKHNNEIIMKQRSTAIRVAAERKQKQLEEVQEAKEMLLREQRERIEAETRRNELLAEEAKRGVDRMKLKKLEEAKEKHIQERLRAEENIQRSKHDLLLEKKKLEDQISEKLKRANEIQSEREKTILISKIRARQEGVRRDIIRHELESFDEKARRAQLFSMHIDRRNQII